MLQPYPGNRYYLSANIAISRNRKNTSNFFLHSRFAVIQLGDLRIRFYKAGLPRFTWFTPRSLQSLQKVRKPPEIKKVINNSKFYEKMEYKTPKFYRLRPNNNTINIDLSQVQIIFLPSTTDDEVSIKIMLHGARRYLTITLLEYDYNALTNNPDYADYEINFEKREAEKRRALIEYNNFLLTWEAYINGN